MFIIADASQLEWRVAIELSNDQVGLNEVRDKQDTHTLNETAFKLPSRLIAKKYLFRTIFRGSGYAFSRDPEFSHVSSSNEFWDDINRQFYSKYNGLDKWHLQLGEICLKGHPIVGPLGRSWTINMVRGKRSGELEIPWTILTNYPVQGTGADIMKIARVSFYKKVRKAGIPCLFITTIHDSIVVDAEGKYLDAITCLYHETFASLTQNIQNMFGYVWSVPLECEVKYGANMKDTVKYT